MPNSMHTIVPVVSGMHDKYYVQNSKSKQNNILQHDGLYILHILESIYSIKLNLLVANYDIKGLDRDGHRLVS